MTMENKKGIVFTFLFFLLLGLGILRLTQSDKKENVEVEKQATVIPVIFLINPDTGENENEELVKEFNEEYKGIYQVQVEWIMDTAEGYRSKIKLLNAVDQLPAVITDAEFDADLYNLLMQYNRLINLNPYIQKSAEWMEALGVEAVDSQREKDGSVFVSVSGNTMMSYGGFYYNKRLFKQAGIDEFPDTWEEFFDCLKKLKEAGITPLAIHGGSSYWTTMLIATGYLTSLDGGKEFLNEQYPNSYDVPCVRQMFEMMKEMYQYTFDDALEIDRKEATDRFIMEEAAIIANGGWMIDNMSEKSKQNLGYASFPGNILMQDLKMSGWAVTAGYPDQVTKGAIEFLKYRAIREEKMEEEYLAELPDNILEREYTEAVEQVQVLYPNYQLKWETQIQESFFVNEIPLYVKNKIDEDSFINSLNDEIQKINAEK